MFDKIRKHYILISALSVGIILVMILLCMNIANYLTTIINIKEDVSLIIDAHEFPAAQTDQKKNDVSDHYFTVDLKGDAPIYDIRNISRISTAEMDSLFNEAKNKEQSNGRISNFYFGSNVNKDFYVFIDCKDNFADQNRYILTSVLVGTIGYFATLGAIIISSKRVLKPIQDSIDKQKNFISDASHELKTPLAIISANNELIEMMNGESESTKAITKQVQRMNGMVKNLTSLAKLSAQEENERFSPILLSVCLYSACDTFSSLISRGGRAFDHDIVGGIIIKGDEALINQLIGILLENASKYALTKTEVILKKDEENAKLIVRNDAEGLVEGEHLEVFDRFTRSSYARANKEGSGIGLAIAKEIVTLHHDSIKAYVENNDFCIEVEFVNLIKDN